MRMLFSEAFSRSDLQASRFVQPLFTFSTGKLAKSVTAGALRKRQMQLLMHSHTTALQYVCLVPTCNDVLLLGGNWEVQEVTRLQKPCQFTGK